MSNFEKITIRIQADTLSFDNPTDIIRNSLPQFWRGNDIQFEIGVFAGDELLSVSNYASITLAIRQMTPSGQIPSSSDPAVMEKSCDVLDDTVTLETWNGRTNQHACITFSATESNILPGDHWLSIWATTNDDLPKTVTLCAGIIRVSENGGGITSQPPIQQSPYYTAEQCDDTFVSLSSIDPDKSLGTSDEKIPTQHAVKSYVDSHASSGENNTASNIGTGHGIFAKKTGIDLQFKSIIAGNNIDIQSDTDSITIATSSSQLVNPMTDAGDLIIGGDNGTPTKLPLGTAGQVLTTNDSADGVQWADVSSCELPVASTDNLGGIKPDGTTIVVDSETGIASAIAAGEAGMQNPMTGTGDIIVGGDDGAPTKLSLGSAGQVLTTNDSEDGVQWADVASYELPVASTDNLGGIKPDGTTIVVDAETGVASAISSGEAGMQNPMTNAGDLIVGGDNGAPTKLTLGTAGQVLTTNDSEDGIQWADVASYELPIASTDNLGGIKPDGTTIVVDAETGVASAIASGEAGMQNPMTDAGDLIVGGNNGTPTKLPLGTAGQVLTTNDSADGLEWADVAAYELPVASTEALGGIKPDGTTIVVDSETGVASAVTELPVASTDNLGGIKPDGTTIVVDAETGVASAVASGVSEYSVTTHYTSDNAWYRIWTNNWIEQGGTGTATGTLTFPMAFADTNYTFVCAPIRVDSSDGTNDICWHTKTTTKIGVEIRYDGTCQIGQQYSWYACGFVAQ